MKILHLADLHYCGKHLQHVDAAVEHAIDAAVAAGCTAAIIAGDSFDAAVNLHEPAVDAFFRRVRQLADRMPVLVLQGTFSHDRPGAIAPLRHVGEGNVYVSDKIEQVALRSWMNDAGTTSYSWESAANYAFAEPPKSDTVSDVELVVSCLPSINKGAVAAAVGVENAASQAGEMVAALCQGWAVTNRAMRTLGVPTVLVGHGTVNGSVTETAHAMVSQDHEFSAGALFSADTSAVMLGHIHNHQSWQDGPRQIAYPGSITKMIYGHRGTVGALIWDLDAEGGSFRLVETPSRRLIELTYDGLPDMDDLERAAADCAGAYVRIRGSVDEEHRKSVDKDAIHALFAAAAEVKLEVRVNPVQRVRASGISQSKSLAEQLGQWCEVTETGTDPLVERLALLEHKDHREIIEGVVNGH